jgi:hypothetical protein
VLCRKYLVLVDPEAAIVVLGYLQGGALVGPNQLRA